MEPLANFGYVGFTTRFPQAYASQAATGSPVLKSFTDGNVAVIQLDGNDLSAELETLVRRSRPDFFGFGRK